MYRRLTLALGAVLTAGAAQAADRPAFGPPPEWVKPVTVSLTPAKGAENAPVGVILQDLQVKFTPQGEASYWRLTAKVQTPQGLSVLGALSPAWNPDTDILTIHKVHIIRDGKVIDVLAGGRTFTVLRRETKLEQATLDGTLTAALQIEDLRVGDIVDLAWTLEHDDPVLKGHIQEDVRPNAPTGGHIRLRLIWPADAGVRTRDSVWMPPPAANAADGLSTQSFTIDDAPPVISPKGAPARFMRGREVEVSNFAAWADVSAMMSPLFDKAEQIAPDSPLQSEIKRIAASSQDPKQRASAALSLVESQVRYVLLALDGGGLTPASADLTWSRRFGDCKGKTVLLLALLRGLGIEAEPALVSSTGGDGLDERLPALTSFDHVIVRAKVGGRDYWLDGTRDGDGPIDTIETPPFRWALPLRPSGATLVKLEQAPLSEPNSETTLRLDASAGLVATAKAHIETVIRGDAGRLGHLALAQLAADQRNDTLKKFWTSQHGFNEITSVAETFNPSTNEERLVADGTTSLDWSGSGLEALSSRLATRPDLARDPGPNSDAPFAVSFPDFEKYSETVTLPNGGKGFSVAGQDIDETVAGVAYARKASLKDGVFTVTASKRTLAPEFAASQAPAVTAALADLAERTLYLAPPGASARASDAPAEGEAPTTAAAYVAQGLSFRAQDRGKEAMEAFDQALVLDPKSAAALGARAAMVAAVQGMADKATADAEAALKLDPNQESAIVARALMAETDRRWPDELGYLNRAIRIDPHDGVALATRGGVELQNNQTTAAHVDFAEARRWGAQSPYVLNLVCYEAAMRGYELDQALSDCDAAIKMAPKAADILDSRGFVLLRLKRDDEAIAQYDSVLSLEPFTAESLLGRSLAERRRGRTADADRDLQAALAADPKVGDEFKRYGVTN